MNDWRVLRYRPGAAHLWTPILGGLDRTRCGRMTVINLAVTTIPLELGMGRKCRGCVRFASTPARTDRN